MVPVDEITIRWHAYRLARMQVWTTDIDCYDRYIHPRLRVCIEQVLRDHPEVASLRASSEVAAHAYPSCANDLGAIGSAPQ